jgi:ribosome-binding factor A
MANPRRILRLQQLVLETAATFIQRSLEDPRIGLVSITRVKLSPDLSHAILYWSCLGDEAVVRTTERGLHDALPSIQRAVAGAMQTRVTPRIELRHDRGLEHAQRMEELFEQIHRERAGPADPDPDGDEAPDPGSPEEGRG